MVPTAVLAAQYAGTLEYLETSRIDVRANQPLPVAPAPPPREVALASDASFSPVARLRLNDRRWDYALSYSPTFTVTDIELTASAQPVVLNAGTVSVAWHDRFVRFFASESASYGWENLAYLYGTPVAGQVLAAGQAQSPGQGAGQTAGPVPGQTSGQAPGQTGTAPTVPLQTFPFGSSNTSAGMLLRATRSVTLSLSGGYSLSGNLTNNPQATSVYPEQFGPSAAASVAYAASPLDALVTTVSAQQITTPMGVCASPSVGQSCREVDPILLAQETARRRISTTATLSANLGVSASVYRLVSGDAWGILPIGGVTFTDRFSAPPRDPRQQLEASGIRVSAELVPTVNIFTGSPSNRFQVSGSFVMHVATGVVLSFVGGVLQTVPLPQPDPSPLTIFNGGVDLRVRMTPLISVSAGIQAFWQQQQNVGALPVASNFGTTGPTTSAAEVGYVALTVRTPKLRL